MPIPDGNVHCVGIMRGCARKACSLTDRIPLLAFYHPVLEYVHSTCHAAICYAYASRFLPTAYWVYNYRHFRDGTFDIILHKPQIYWPATRKFEMRETSLLRV